MQPLRVIWRLIPRILGLGQRNPVRRAASLLMLSALLVGCSAASWGSPMGGLLLSALLASGLWVSGCAADEDGGGGSSSSNDVAVTEVSSDTPAGDATGETNDEDTASTGDGVGPDTTSDDVTPSEVTETTDGQDPVEGDKDQDGVLDKDDNCPLVANPLQEDEDVDGYGDACQNPQYISPCCGPECGLDSDGDGLPDNMDLCPWTASGDSDDIYASNVDTDGDGVGDDCDDSDDQDGDGVLDVDDNCPRVANPGQENSDGGEEFEGCDILGDACDLCDDPDCLSPCGEPCCYDADGDGVLGGYLPDHSSACGGGPPEGDNCPFEPNEDQLDSDGDGFGDACDNCPDVSNTWQWDVDGDGVGDDCEEDQTLGSLTPADAADQRVDARRLALASLLERGVVSPTAFLDAWDGPVEDARVALADSLRRRFVAQGVLRS